MTAHDGTLVVRRVRAGTLFKLLFIGLIISFPVTGPAFGIAAFFGAGTVTWNREPVHGVATLFARPGIMTVLALAFTAIVGAFASAGLWLYSLFRPLAIHVAPHDGPTGGEAGAARGRGAGNQNTTLMRP